MKTLVVKTLLVGGMTLAFGSAAVAEVNMQYVSVGDPGNVDDAHGDGYGGVGYVYRIAKYEVTAGQYCEFLNSVAGTDTHGVYDEAMWTSSDGCKIQRNGTPGNYTYSIPDPNRLNRPANYVDWYDSLRFANWLQNAQPTGGQVDGVTEDGTYDFYIGPYGKMLVTLPDRSTFAAHHVVLPTEDEWYKAAYYKGGGPNAGYWDSPTQSDLTPDNNPPAADTGNSANYFDPISETYAVGAPYYTSEVGAYDASESPCGTFDQGGNLWEWTEQTYSNGMTINRGGSFGGEYWWLWADTRGWTTADNSHSNAGFRVAEVPVLGDANFDRMVDSADLAIWQQNYDPLGVNENTFAMGDWDGNGVIDSADLALWQQNYDPIGTLSVGAAHAPEPATLSLLALGGLGVLTRRRK